MEESLRLARYELAYLLNRPVTLLLALLPLMQGLWVGYEYLLPGSTSLDAGYQYGQLYRLLASNVPALIGLTTLSVGYGLMRDQELRTDVFLYSLPVASTFWLMSRFLGQLAFTLLVAIGYPIGIGIALTLHHQYNYIMSAFVLVDGFTALTASNLFILASLTAALTIRLRSMAGAYIAFALGMINWLVIIFLADQLTSDDIFALLDPFGLVLIQDAVRQSTPGQLTTTLLNWTDTWYINRLGWIGCSLALLHQADRRFADYWLGEIRRERSTDTLASTSKLTIRLSSLSVSQQPLDSPDWWGSLGRSTRFEFSQLRRQPFLWAGGISILGVTLALATVLRNTESFIPLPTSASLTALRQPISVLISCLMLLLTGEVVNRDQLMGLESVFTVLPQPAWIRITAKYVALSTAALLIVGFVSLVMVLIQITSSLPLSAIDWELYAQDMLLETGGRQLQLIALFLLISVLTRQRFLGHALSFLGLILLSYAQQRRIVSPWLLYSSLPTPAVYSELIGYGPLSRLRLLISLQWSLLALLLVATSTLVWTRATQPGKDRRRVFWTLPRLRVVLWIILGILLSYGLLGTLQIDHVPYLPVVEPMVGSSKPAASRHARVSSQDGHLIQIDIRYHHPYQVNALVNRIIVALQQGEHLFGPYPYSQLRVEEVPKGRQADVENRPGCIRLAENQGWLAGPDSTQLDYLDYLLTREVIRQWWQRRVCAPTAGSSLFTHSLPEYLALQAVKMRYGSDRLAKRLAQRAARVSAWRGSNRTQEPALTQTTNQTVIAQDQAAVVFTQIGEVWGDSALQTCIGQYYRQSAGRPLTTSAFVHFIEGQLPDSLAYLTSYLTHRFRFDLRIGQIGRLPDELVVTLLLQKFDQNRQGQLIAVNPFDWVPIVLTDDKGRQLYRELIRPGPDSPPFRLPLVKGATQVVIDPLRVWMTANQSPHSKRF
ncbi:hypothetical protein GCM10028819_09220 [Spirosoma humi]